MSKEKDSSFEELMQKLEDITNKLEKENLNLDESVKLFEEGMNISKQASKKLENAEKRITVILDPDGEGEEENFIIE
jgi:exodeoxyribonuclease VII small subunit